MSATTRAILLAVLAEGAAAAVVLALYGAGAEGAVIAARVTARVSAVVFSIALVMRALPSGASAMCGFIAAHTVHYTAVAYLAVVAVEHHLHHLTTRSVVVIIIGLLLLAVIASTTSATTVWRARLNAAAVSIAFATFFGGAIVNGAGLLGQTHWPALLPLPALVAGLSWHLRNVRRARLKEGV